MARDYFFLLVLCASSIGVHSFSLTSRPAGYSLAKIKEDEAWTAGGLLDADLTALVPGEPAEFDRANDGFVAQLLQGGKKSWSWSDNWQQYFVLAVSGAMLLLACSLLSKRGGGAWNAIYMVAYLIMGATEYLVVRLMSVKHGGLPFHAPAAVVLIEATKLLITVVLLTVAGTWHRFREPSRADIMLLTVPAAMYFVLNTLFYIAVSSVVLATYAIVFEMQIIIVAVLHRIVFARVLSPVQTLACFGIVLGALVQSSGEYSGDMDWMRMCMPALVAVWAATCTVTCEYVFKSGQALDLNVQNTYMYSFGIVLGCILLALVRWHHGYTFLDLAAGLHHPEVVVLLAIRAFHGIATSRILKYIDSFSKTIGSVLTGPLSIGVAPFLLNEHISTYTVIAIGITYTSSLAFWIGGQSGTVGGAAKDFKEGEQAKGKENKV